VLGVYRSRGVGQGRVDGGGGGGAGGVSGESRGAGRRGGQVGRYVDLWEEMGRVGRRFTRFRGLGRSE